MKWRRDNSFIGLRGRTEANYCKGSAQLYATGAEIAPLDDDQRATFTPAPPDSAKYTAYAWVKWGHRTEAREMSMTYVSTVEEGKRLCDEWLEKNGTKS